MSNLFFSSDLHFFHKNIIKYSNRPFSSVEEMNQKLIDNWNAVVKPQDTIYSLGDFSFANYLLTCTVLKQLNGQHHMILGNHDKTIVLNETKILASGWVKSISHYKEIRHHGITIVLFHYPMRTWNKAHHDSILLHGHCHGSLAPFGKSVDVGVDAKFIHSEYRPTSLDEVFDYMSKRDFIKVDHHDEGTM
jgi:calcineurin-like phosphoesterase family protein